MVTRLHLAVSVAVSCIGVVAGAAPEQRADDDHQLRALLVSSADWLMDHNASGICLRTNHKCEGVLPVPGWTGKNDDDWGNYVTGNLARTLLAAGIITGNQSYTDEGLAWADTFCAEQRNTTSAAGSPAGFWPEEIYFADTGTGVTALAFAVHLADTPWRKTRYMDVLTRYASYVLEGCNSPPGNESARWGHPIGTHAHPYSWVIQSGPDKGSMGDGYWNGTLNDWPYTIATATTGAGVFTQSYGISFLHSPVRTNRVPCCWNTGAAFMAEMYLLRVKSMIVNL